MSATRAKAEIGNADLPIGPTARSAANSTPAQSSKPADREIGVPSFEALENMRDLRHSPAWRSRGYLPHFDSAEAIQHVTYHLADSLPREVAERLRDGIALLPPEQQTITLRRRIEEWLDAGHGSCILRDPDIGRIVEEAFLFFDGERYRLFAWTVMPNHVHVLFQPLSGWPMSGTVASWKKFTARKISDYLKTHKQAGIGRAHSVANASIWHREYWDRFIRNEAHFRKAIDYIHQNPVAAGLIARAEDWPRGSARRNWERRSPDRQV